MGDETATTLYVGNLSHHMTESFMYAIFNSVAVGACTGCKMIYESNQDPYCFVEFTDHANASHALTVLNGREIQGRPMKVNWATSPNSKNNSDGIKKDTSDLHHIFCGDLSPDIESKQLRDAFSAFGEISGCKVITDIDTGKSKGYGFIIFVKKEDAQRAIDEMNGAWLGNRAIRTNWATKKPLASERSKKQNLNYEEVFATASDTNTTVYVGGVHTGLSEDILRDTFSKYGKVAEIRCFHEKGFAFVRLDSKSAAAKAIVGTNGQEICGYQCKCSWGKESSDSQRPSNYQQPAYGYGQQQQPQQQAYSNTWNGYPYTQWDGQQQWSSQQQQQAQQWGAQQQTPQQWTGQQQTQQQTPQTVQQQWPGQWGSGDPNWQSNYAGYQQQQQQGYDYSQYGNNYQS